MSAPDSNGLLMAHPYGAVILIVLFLVVMAFLNLRWREKASTRRHRRYRATAGRGSHKVLLLLKYPFPPKPLATPKAFSPFKKKKIVVFHSTLPII
ncbi:hypothetical protein R9T27_12025, partial [Escherichia coli]